MGKINDLTGQVFGRLTVIEKCSTRGNTQYLCQCECGTERVVRLCSLISGCTKSCGCLAREMVSERNTTHGMYGTPTYNSWNGMKDRCLNPNSNGYKDYGGRGITICDRWLESFENFYSDMGEKPKGLSIERIDNDGNYEPLNCMWATQEQQIQNRKITKLNEVKVRRIREIGRSKPLKVIADMFGVSLMTISDVLRGHTWVNV